MQDETNAIGDRVGHTEETSLMQPSVMISRGGYHKIRLPLETHRQTYALQPKGKLVP
jgi:hypothetical protein